MGRLAKICKIYGEMEARGVNGKKVVWVYDYANNKPRIKSEMTKEEIALSEKAKREQISQEN
jgi:major membrane immunogen (membrane-anchored lipoprotein)